MDEHGDQQQDGSRYEGNPFGEGTKLCPGTLLKPLPEEGKQREHGKPNQHVTAAGQHNRASGANQSKPTQHTLLIVAGKQDNGRNRDQICGEILGVVKAGQSALGTGQIAQNVSLNGSNAQCHAQIGDNESDAEPGLRPCTPKQNEQRRITVEIAKHLERRKRKWAPQGCDCDIGGKQQPPAGPSGADNRCRRRRSKPQQQYGWNHDNSESVVESEGGCRSEVGGR